MDEIKQWAWMLCGSIMVCGLIDFLLPSGNSKKSGKLAVGLVFLSCLMLPLKGTGELDFPQLSLEQNQQAEELYQSQEKLAYSMAKNHILELIQASLSERKLNPQEITLILTEESLSVELEFSVSLQNREQEIRQAVKESCGAEDIQIQWQEET